MKLEFFAILVAFLVNLFLIDAASPNIERQPDSETYLVCKETHRCDFGFEEYDKNLAKMSYTQRIFPDDSGTEAVMFRDFEDWRVGTHGFTSDGEIYRRPSNAHGDLFASTSLGSLVVTSTCLIDINTDTLKMESSTCVPGNVLIGDTQLSPDGTSICIFVFDELMIGPDVRIEATGSKALVLASRSTMIMEGTLIAESGSLGGFLGSDVLHTNNLTGPNSPNKRVYTMTVSTDDTNRDEIQEVVTSANSGQTLRGTFQLCFDGACVKDIPHNILAEELKKRLEDELEWIGEVGVIQGKMDDEEGFTWKITYKTAIGDVVQLEATSSLTGIGSKIESSTIIDGNTLTGEFNILINGNPTTNMPVAATGDQMENSLLSLDFLDWAHAFRSDPTEQCSHGLCIDGPNEVHGYNWTVVFSTDEGNVSPTSPTSPLSSTTDPEFTITGDPTSLNGISPIVNITLFHSETMDPISLHDYEGMMPEFFSLAFGGSGGSNGGIGGSGHGAHCGKPNINRAISDLVGGSAGAVGGDHPYYVVNPNVITGIGGNGGAAIEFLAVNDLFFTDTAIVQCNGGNGADGQYAGGGGAGGTVQLSAGGIVEHRGIIEVKGGNGGSATPSAPLRGGGAGGGGRVAFYGQRSVITGTVDVTPGTSGDGAACSGNTDLNGYCNLQCEPDVWPPTETEKCCCCATKGSLWEDGSLAVGMRVDATMGAMDTQASLFLSGGHYVTGTTGLKSQPFFGNGPLYTVESSQPYRWTLFFRLDKYEEGGSLSNSGPVFALHESGTDGTREAIIAVGVSNGGLAHGANTPDFPVDSFLPRVRVKRWYKLDVRVLWATHTYNIFIDGVMLVENATFEGDDVSAFGVYIQQHGSVWVDEIFLGDDYNMGFRVPTVSTDGSKLKMERPDRKGWNVDALGSETTLHEMTRHESHFSQRPKYSTLEKSGIIPYDGAGHNKFDSDIKQKYDAGSKPESTSEVLPGSTLFVPGSRLPESDGILTRSMDDSASTTAGSTGGYWNTGTTGGGDSGKYFWFGDHNNKHPLKDSQSNLWGGIMCASTDDFVTWKEEGVMLHYVNITDDETGSSDKLIVERPHVLYNEKTDSYVMWMHVDDEANTIGLAGVAESDNVNGPYRFLDTFRPDGNQTHDLSVFPHPYDSTKALLVRTFYATVSYLLPASVLQPIWESVQGSDGEIDYGLNYHRAFYNAGYDEPSDIYMQRWRNEDKEWQIKHGPWLETYDLTTQRHIFVHETTGETHNIDPADRDSLLDELVGPPYEFTEPEKFQVEYIGQGKPQVETRYRNPDDAENSFWSPSSVPAVKAQSWKDNYADKNIADNPPHPTVPDKLIGVEGIVEQRRAKYVAVSELSDDFRSVTKVLSVFEGELEDADDLISLLGNIGSNTEQEGAGLFGWSPKETIEQTNWIPEVAGSDPKFALETEDDWYDRFHQYYQNPNDRADGTGIPKEIYLKDWVITTEDRAPIVGDFVNFRNVQTSDTCPKLHQTCLDLYANCLVLWDAQYEEKGTPITDFTFTPTSYYKFTDTSNYENCIASYRTCLGDYQQCVEDSYTPDHSFQQG